MINLLNGTIIMKGKRVTVGKSIEMFVQSFVKTLEDGASIKMDFPSIETFLEDESL